MRHKAFDFFKSKNIFEADSFYFPNKKLKKRFIEDNGIAYPEIFMFFLKYFKIQKSFITDNYFCEDIQRVIPLNQIIHYPTNNSYAASIVPDSWLENQKEFFDELSIFHISDYFYDSGTTLIGFTYEQKICLGITPKTCDQIWIVANYYLDEAKSAEAIKAADNIFEYINALGFTTPLRKIDYLVKFRGDVLWTDLQKNHSSNYKEAIKNSTLTLKCGFDFLHSKEYLESSKILESKFAPVLPEKYKFFLQYFNFLGPSGLIKDRFYNEKLNEEIEMEEIARLININGIEKITIKKMYNESEILSSMGKIEVLRDLCFWDIGTTQTDELITVCLIGEHKDGIYLKKQNGNLKIAIDIFEFISGFISIPKELPTKQLYKIWGEPFWRELERDALDFWKKREGLS